MTPRATNAFETRNILRIQKTTIKLSPVSQPTPHQNPYPTKGPTLDSLYRDALDNPCGP